MYRYFENLVDAFAPFSQATPPKTYWAFVKTQLAPLRRVIPWVLLTGLVVAVMESGLIFYSGRLIDLMSNSPASAFWPQHGLELTLAVLFIVFARPIIIALQRLLLEQTVAGTLQDQTRWRAHKHMLGQSSSFFQNDFAGRLSNRVMRLGEAVEDTIYMAFEAIWYFVVYIVVTTWLLAQTDWRLGFPMLIWACIYAIYTYRVAIRVSAASEKLSNARSMVTGRVVDSYANIESVKLFAHNAREESYALTAMRRHRIRFHRFLRLMTELSLVSNLINGLLIVGVLGSAVWLWLDGAVSVGEVAAASALVIRLNGMSGWIMWVTIRLFEHAGTIREGLESVAVPHAVTDAPRAISLQPRSCEVRFDNLTHHYGRDMGGIDHINLTIQPGERLGLIGRSGAGKSSLVNLLLRFRDPEGGRILIERLKPAGGKKQKASDWVQSL